MQQCDTAGEYGIHEETCEITIGIIGKKKAGQQIYVN